MRPALEILEQIEKYINNTLSADEKKAFETKMQQDTELATQVGQQRNVQKGIERYGAKQSIIKAGNRYETIRRIKLASIMFIAIGIIALLTYSLFTNKTQSIVSNQTILREDKASQTEKKTISLDIIHSKTSFQTQKINYQDSANSLRKKEVRDKVIIPTKQAQFFIINSSKDTTIIGNEGTKISFKANFFDVSKKEFIKIELKEFYKRTDIAFSNLTTQTIDNKLLETGGMVFLEATLNNKKVYLKKDKTYVIEFPYKDKKEGMLLFKGVENSDKIVWDEINTEQSEPILQDNRTEFGAINQSIFLSSTSTPTEASFVIVEDMPTFKGGEKALFKYLQKNVDYPEIPKRMGISGTVYVSFLVRKDGVISNVSVLKGVDLYLDQEAMRVISSMPNWEPGKQRGKQVDVQYNLPIRFVLSGDDILTKYTPQQIQEYKDSLADLKRKNIENLIYDSKNKNEVAQMRAKQELSAYMFSNNTFGWINCDRYLNKATNTQIVKINDKTRHQITVIYHNSKSQLITATTNGITSILIPINEKVTVFSIKYENNLPLVCLEEMIYTNQDVELKFEPFTKEKLQKCLERINNI